MLKFRRLCLILILFFCGLASLAEEASTKIPWRGWEGAFQTARAENRFVLLNLEAVWCHWCHVMEKTTYQDVRVVRLLNEHTVPVKVDQDARPDLGLRYQDYGWPATIIFDQQGRELARLTGYQDPDEMTEILEKLIANPQPLPDEAPATRAGKTPLFERLPALEKRHYGRYDEERGGWGRMHKFVNSPVLEYCLEKSLAGSAPDEKMARTTLTNNLALVDPVWGGVYQYSDSGVWSSPHYEKIMSTQAGNLRVYSLAYAQFGDPAYLQAARDIVRYMTTFLRSPEGAFRPSQDADLVQGKKAHDYFALADSQRRELGIPRVDPHLYARENGWAIEALALYAGIAQDSAALHQAVEAADWVVLKRRLPGGEFQHGDKAGEVLFLGDTLACGRGFLALYQATGQRRWLDLASQSADAVLQLFTRPDIDGVLTANSGEGRTASENVAAARFANLLFYYTGQPRYRDLAAEALSFFAVEGATDDFNPGGLLLACQEAQRAPRHITVVGAPGNPRREALLRAARKAPSSYLRLDLWEPGTPLPPNSEVEYPTTPSVAAYVCSEGRCSAPVETEEALGKLFRRQKAQRL